MATARAETGGEDGTPIGSPAGIRVGSPASDSPGGAEDDPQHLGSIRSKLWLAYLALGILLVGAYFFVPPFAHAGWMFNIIGGSAVLAIVAGIRVHRPRHSLPWYLFALGQALFVGGDVLAYNYQRFFGTALPFPSAADVLYLAVFPFVVAGILLLIRHRTPGGDRGGLIDSLILSIGAGVLSWLFLIAPYAHDRSLSLLTKLISIAYPLMDLLILSVLIRLAVGSGRRSTAYHLMLVSVLALIGTDSVYGWYLLHGGYTTGGWLDGGWALFYLLWGAAALHPSMRLLSGSSAGVKRAFTNRRRFVVTCAVLVVPAVQAVQTLRSKPTDAGVLIGASVALFLLVVARMTGLVRQHEAAEGRERLLREAGETFAAVSGRQSIVEAAARSLDALVDSSVGVEIYMRLPGETALFEMAVTTGTGRRSTPAEVPAATESSPPISLGPHLVALTAGEMVELPARGMAALLGSGSPNAGAGGLVVPVRLSDGLLGVAIVRTPTAVPASVRSSAMALASQAALAIQNEEFAARLHRQFGEARFESLVEHASDVIAILELGGEIRYVSPSLKRVLGYAAADIVGTSFFDLVDPEDAALIAPTSSGRHCIRSGSSEIRARHQDGTWLNLEIIATDLSNDPMVGKVVLNARDITERKVLEAQLRHQAFRDPVTGLANRALFQDRVAHATERTRRMGAWLSVLYLDLDDFKSVNDSLGHAAGDQLLAEVAARLTVCLRAEDTAARLGGDEFAILLEHGTVPTAVEVADRIIRALARPFDLGGNVVTARASIGMSFSDPLASVGPEDLLRDADIAMYTAKREGKGGYQIFELEMQTSVVQRLELRADLQRAIKDKEFFLDYQPIVVLATGRMSGVEALVRWQHPVKGRIQPDEFIPLAEETGLIVPLGRWIVEEACRQAVHFQRLAGPGPVPTMSVNLSARQLQHPEIVNEVRSAIRKAGLDARTLVLEITESAMMADMESAVTRLQQLKDLGLRVAMDDFGTGYCSLNYIRSLPVDILKIDKSFVAELMHEGEMPLLTATIVNLAAVLELQSVAEGIEHAEQLSRLIELNCELGQGYLFARPMAPGDLGAKIRRDYQLVLGTAGEPETTHGQSADDSSPSARLAGLASGAPKGALP